MIYNYYPGCTLSTKAKQLDMAARRCAEVLGFPLVELPEWQCCGAVYPMAPDAIAERLSAVRALVAARENGGVVCITGSLYLSGAELARRGLAP